jgi:hypothetical protein
MKINLSTIKNLAKLSMQQVTNTVTKPITNTKKITKLAGNDVINASKFKSYAMINVSIKEEGLCFAPVPKEYASTKLIDVEESSYKVRFGEHKGEIRTVPAHQETERTWKPRYHIDKLWTTGKGSGTRSVQDVVRQSLQNIRTQGRVTLEACCIDGKTAPGGFYYKLGFRFTNPEMNKMCEEWIEHGGLRENAPYATGMMYLPRENISQCLNYHS